MSYSITKKESFHIIGIQCRTTNEGGQAKEDIGQLWAQWFSKGLQAQIPNKANEHTFNIYFDYESDHRGPYAVLLGCQVENLETIPEGMLGFTFEASDYARYDYRGQVPEVVVDCWTKIWTEDSYERKYAADFDVYLPGGSPPEDGIVQTYVSI